MRTFGQFLLALPMVAMAAAFIAAVVVYAVRNQQGPAGWSIAKKFRVLAGGVIAFRLLYALALTVLQYYVWSDNSFTRLLTRAPLPEHIPFTPLTTAFSFLFDNRIGYFLFFSWGRFWLGHVIAIVVALAFLWFFRRLQKHKDRFFEEGEVELGFAAALIVGWPNFVIFVPLLFVSIVVISLVRRLYYKRFYTTFGAPFLLAAFLTLAFGNSLLEALDLGVLRI